MLKIAAVLVTYNRLELLKEAVSAVKDQDLRVDHFIIIDNNSTDGTRSWLDTQEGIIVKYQENSGGSGGFYSGIAMAATYNVDWVWVMDDDTIPQPDTLRKLVEKLPLIKHPVGFFSSKSIWKDGSPHLMNIPAIGPSFNRTTPFNTFDNLKMLLTETSSFVSLLINMSAVKEVGLPYKEFFIWGDDQEYTRRITKNGYLGIYCIDSIVLHKTPINYFPDFYHDTPPNLWKHSYGFRNEFFMVRKNKGWLFYLFWLPAKLAYTSMNILRIRNTDRWAFIRVLTGSAWKSIFFNPQIETI